MHILIFLSDPTTHATAFSLLRSGKVRSNFVGTEYTVYDDGESPDKMEKDGSSGREVVRQELGECSHADECFNENMYTSLSCRHCYLSILTAPGHVCAM